MKTEAKHPEDQPQAGCNVSSKFNFTVGGLAFTVALLLGYWAYLHWWK